MKEFPRSKFRVFVEKHPELTKDQKINTALSISAFILSITALVVRLLK
jgi:hypothetical protein